MNNRLIRPYNEILDDFEKKLNTKNHINETEKENCKLTFIDHLDKFHEHACELEILLNHVINEDPSSWCEKINLLLTAKTPILFHVFNHDYEFSRNELFVEVMFFRHLFDNPFYFNIYNKETPNKTIGQMHKTGDFLFSFSEKRKGKIRTWTEEKRLCAKKVSDYSKMKMFYFNESEETKWTINRGNKKAKRIVIQKPDSYE